MAWKVLSGLEEIRPLFHLLLPLCIHWTAAEMPTSVIVDVVTDALCTVDTTCAEVIYINGLQQTVSLSLSIDSVIFHCCFWMNNDSSLPVYYQAASCMAVILIYFWPKIFGCIFFITSVYNRFYFWVLESLKQECLMISELIFAENRRGVIRSSIRL